jgi:hypothetical protein
MFIFLRYSLKTAACSAEERKFLRHLLGNSWLLSSEASRSAASLPGIPT